MYTVSLTVSHDFSAGRLGHLEIFWPVGQVLHVEWQSILQRVKAV